MAKYYNETMWDSMTSLEQTKSQKNRQVNTFVMTTADVFTFAAAHRQTVTDLIDFAKKA